jgi:ABC-type bacteriocin/lantibiotic exporter with double-glycine peptidase domain
MSALIKMKSIILNFDTPFYVWSYSALSVVTILCSSLRVILIAYGSMRASRQLHDSLIKKILRYPIRFFETTPVGRILNRMSKDIKDIDSDM